MKAEAKKRPAGRFEDSGFPAIQSLTSGAWLTDTALGLL